MVYNQQSRRHPPPTHNPKRHQPPTCRHIHHLLRRRRGNSPKHRQSSPRPTLPAITIPSDNSRRQRLHLPIQNNLNPPKHHPPKSPLHNSKQKTIHTLKSRKPKLRHRIYHHPPPWPPRNLRSPRLRHDPHAHLAPHNPPAPPNQPLGGPRLPLPTPLQHSRNRPPRNDPRLQRNRIPNPPPRFRQ